MSIARPPSSSDEATPFASLLERAKHGSCSAQDYLLGELRQFLLKLANEETPEEVRAERNPSDLVQQSLLIAHRRLDDFRGATRAEFRHWARVILRRQIQDSLQRVRRRPDLAMNRISLDDIQTQGTHPIHNGAGAAAEAVCREERQLLAVALGRLSERHRLALSLREGKSLSFSEMGADLNCSSEAARKLWARAVCALAKELKNHRDD